MQIQVGPLCEPLKENDCISTHCILCLYNCNTIGIWATDMRQSTITNKLMKVKQLLDNFLITVLDTTITSKEMTIKEINNLLLKSFMFTLDISEVSISKEILSTDKEIFMLQQ